MTLGFVVSAFLLVAASVVYFTQKEIDTVDQRHTEILESEVREAAASITGFISSRQRMVRTFAFEKQALLSRYLENVEDESLRQEIVESLRRWFPGYFTFTLSDEDGNDLIDDIEGFVGAACLVNIRDHVRAIAEPGHADHAYEAVIHPQANNYHFDILAPRPGPGGRIDGVFFVSFRPDAIADILASHQGPGHRLVLLLRDSDNLIEIAAGGARDRIAAERDIRLTPEESAEIRATRDVEGSRWQLVGHLEPELMSGIRAEIWRNSAILLVFLLATGILSCLIIARLTQQQRRTFDELRTTNEDLREMAAEQRELRRAAESGEQARAQFLAMMSHEIRTPLNAIIGLADLVLKTDLGDAQRQRLSTVAGAGRNLLGLINDILDFSKIEAGRMQVEQIGYALPAVLDQVAQIVGPKAEENGNELILLTSPDIPPMLLGDPLRVGQVLINLAGNAAKFTSGGEIILEISVDRRTGADRLAFSIRDTGIGMTREQVGGLFKPFTQADQSTTRTHGGTGLGLSICRQLVEAMGGSIDAESTPGAGSRFRFDLPLTLPDGQAEPQEAATPFATSTAMLLVWRNPVIREALARSLRAAGFRVTEADITTLAEQDETGEPYFAVVLDAAIAPTANQAVERVRAVPGAGSAAQLVYVADSDSRQTGQNDTSKSPDLPEFVTMLHRPPVLPTLVAMLRSIAVSGDTGLHRAEEIPEFSRQQRLQGLRLLLVEDNEINQEVARGVLEDAGCQVDVAGDGAEAVDVLREFGEDQYAVVLMDIQMPVMDGIAATRIIRDELGYGDLPVIAMTAHAQAEERQRCLDAGMNDHVSKPFSADELVTCITRWAATRGTATRT